MIKRFINIFNNKWVRWSFYSISLLYLSLFRLELDRNHLFVTSDGQIKYYQTVQIAQGEFSKSNCYYPGREIDPDYKYYIFDYPWAFFNQNGMKCAFQYSPYFPSVASLIFNTLGERYITILPLVFWFLALIVFDLILSQFIVRGWIQLFISLSLFFLGFLSLSALDYAELSMNDFLFVSGLYFLVKFLKNLKKPSLSIQDIPQENIKRNNINIIGFVGFFSASILLRPEGFLGIFILLISLLIVLRNQLLPIVFRVNFILPTLATGIAVISLFFIINYQYSGNILGFRASNTGNDMKELYQFSQIGEGIIADLWKSDFKVGLFFALPAIFTIFPIMSILSWVTKKSETLSGLLSLGNILFISGFISVIIIPILSPYRAGYHHFGNRYFETAVIICFLGGGILWETIISNVSNNKVEIFLLKKYFFHKNYVTYGLLLSVLICTYFSMRYTMVGMKVLKDSSKLYNELHNTLDNFGNQKIDQEKFPIVHKSLFTNYLVGSSFIDRNQFLAVESKEYMELEKRLHDSGLENYIEIVYLGQPKFMSDIPRKLYDEKINIQYDSLNNYYYNLEEIRFLDFILVLKKQK